MTSLKIFRSILKRWHVPFMHLTTQPSKRVLLAWTDHSWLKYRTCLTEGGQKFGWPWDQSLVWLVLPLAGQYKYHSEVCGHTPPIQIYPSSFCAYWAYSTFAQRKAVLIGTSGEKSRNYDQATHFLSLNLIPMDLPKFLCLFCQDTLWFFPLNITPDLPSFLNCWPCSHSYPFLFSQCITNFSVIKIFYKFSFRLLSNNLPVAWSNGI